MGSGRLNRIGVKLALVVAAILALQAGVRSAIEAIGYRRAFTEDFLKSGRRHALGMAEAAEYGFLVGDKAELKRIAEMLRVPGDESLQYVAYYDAEGDLLAARSWAPDVDIPAHEPLCFETAVGGPDHTGTHAYDFHVPLRLSRNVIGADDSVREGADGGSKVDGMVNVRRSTGYLDRRIAKKQFEALVASGVMFAAALLGTLAFARGLVRPIQALADGTERIAAGNLGVRVDVGRRRDELGSLAASFNRMAAQLQDQRRQILAHSEHLERTVEQRTAELRRAHEHLRTIIDAIADPFMVLDGERRIVLANRAAREAAGGQDPVEAGLPCHAVFHGSETPCPPGAHPCPLERVVTTKEPSRALHTHYGAEGEPRTVEVSASPVFDESGEVVQVIEACRDITERVRAEEKLRIFQRFAEAAEQGFGMADLDCRVTYVNPALARMLGLSEEQMQQFLGSTFVTAYPEEVQKRLREEIVPAVLRGESWQGELWFETPDGRRVETYESYFLVHDEQGNPLCIADAITDITERKRTEEALRDREAKYRLLAENQRDVVVAVAPDGTLTYCSPAVEEFGGYDAQEELGEPVTKYVATEEDRRRVTEVIEAAVRDQESTSIGFFYRPKEGEPFPVEATGKPVVEDGRVASIQAVLRDITERKRAEEAQKELLQRLQAIMDNVRATIFLKDAKMRYIAVNEPYYELLPQGVDDVTGLCDRDMFPERLAAGFEEEDRKVLETGEPLEKEDRVRLRSGRGAHMAVSLSPVLDGDGRAVGLVGIAYDISEQKRVEAALARSNQELEQFAYVASHDLQEPLRMVSSYCQLLARRYQGQLDEDADEFIHYAVDGASRMQRLIEDLLQYSRVNTRGKPPEPTEADDVLTGVLADLEMHIEETGAEVTHDPLPQVMADPVQLGRLFQNLVSNAIKYRSEDPPRIHIGAARQNGQWRFSVQDNGLGIDPQFHDRVFVIFQRLQARDETGGTGIGLAVCKRIVERHGGRIWVESAEGKGSTFYFTIPAHEQNEEAEEYDYASAGA